LSIYISKNNGFRLYPLVNPYPQSSRDERVFKYLLLTYDLHISA